MSDTAISKPMAGRDGWLPASLYGFWQYEALMEGMIADLALEDGRVVRCAWRYGANCDGSRSMCWWPLVPIREGRGTWGFGSCEPRLLRMVRQ